MRKFILFLILIISNTCFGQDLISRTLEGLTSQSTPEPNEIYKKFKSTKDASTVHLFAWDNRKAHYGQDLVNLKIDRNGLKLLKDGIDNQFRTVVPVSPDKYFEMDLIQVEVQSKEGKLLTSSGESKSPNKMRFYRGVVSGDHGSIVSVSVINGDITFAIYDQDGVYRITPSDFKSDDYSIWIDQAQSEKSFSCGTSEAYQLGNTIHKKIDRNQKADGDIVQIYVECDYEMWLDKGGTAGAEVFVTTLFAEIISLYALENINMEVSDIFVWDISDPYRGNSSLGSVLPQFGANTQNGYTGRIATLLKGDVNNACSVSGLAWVDVLCSSYNSFNNSGPYNVNQGIGYCQLNPNPVSIFDAIDVAVVAHEIGHNIASPHTHACVWGSSNNQAIDDCPGFTEGNCSLVQDPTPSSELGTIMSYCGSGVNFTKGFGTEPGNLMRNRISAATCLSSGGGTNCTHTNISYNNTTIPNNTTVLADNNITLVNNVTIDNNASVMWQAENQFVVNGVFTVPLTAQIEVLSDDCN